jgi:type VI secretion system protein ImpK
MDCLISTATDSPRTQHPDKFASPQGYLCPTPSISTNAGAMLNSLTVAATQLLNLTLNIRQLHRPHQEAALYRQVVAEIQALDTHLLAEGYDQGTIDYFRYALCCVIDEAVMSQPWGHQGAWASHTLLTRFHSESWGGEQFFIRLRQLMVNPEPHRPLLQFFSLCLALGYEGRYRVAPKGEAELRQLRETVHQLLYGASRPNPITSIHMTPRPQPVPSVQAQPLSLALYALAMVLILTLVFLCYHQSLAQQSQQILMLLAGPSSGAL